MRGCELLKKLTGITLEQYHITEVNNNFSIHFRSLQIKN